MASGLRKIRSGFLWMMLILWGWSCLKVVVSVCAAGWGAVCFICQQHCYWDLQYKPLPRYFNHSFDQHWLRFSLIYLSKQQPFVAGQNIHHATSIYFILLCFKGEEGYRGFLERNRVYFNLKRIICQHLGRLFSPTKLSKWKNFIFCLFVCLLGHMITKSPRHPSTPILREQES